MALVERTCCNSFFGQHHQFSCAEFPTTERVEKRYLTEAVERIRDMLKADDGQAWKEARKFLERLEDKGII